MEEIALKFTAKDFKSDQEVRWCPGCGDHAVLSSVQRDLAEVFVTTWTPMYFMAYTDAHLRLLQV